MNKKILISIICILVLGLILVFAANPTGNTNIASYSLSQNPSIPGQTVTVTLTISNTDIAVRTVSFSSTSLTGSLAGNTNVIPAPSISNVVIQAANNVNDHTFNLIIPAGITPDTYSGVITATDNDTPQGTSTLNYQITVQQVAQASNFVTVQDGKFFGIGTNTPSSKLDVIGTGRFTTPGGGTGIQLNIDTGSGNAPFIFWKPYATTDDRFGIRADTNALRLGYVPDGGTIFSNDLNIDKTGNVGIGTTNPQAKLDVSGSMRISGEGESTSLEIGFDIPGKPTLSDGGSGNLNSGTVCYKVTAVYSSGESGVSEAECVSITGGSAVTITWNRIAHAIGYNVYGRSPTYLKVNTILIPNPAQATISFTDTGGSPLGSPIGTTAPPGGLATAGEINMGRELHVAGLGTGIETVGASITIGSTYGPRIASMQEGTDSDRQGLAFFTHPSDTATDPAVEQLRIMYNGNVGIGTPEGPKDKLHIFGEGGASVVSGTETVAIRLGKNTGPRIATIVTGTNDDQQSLAFFTHPSLLAADPAVEQLRVKHTGEIII
ncbi:MAG: hypothetical protein AABW46_02220, partial [Nanoarchaeota archaeon]